jgi:hypothetical protein
VASIRELREAVWDRQHGLCAVTGLPLDWDRDDLHHRLPGGLGGSSTDRDRLSNLIGLLAPAHNLGSPDLRIADVPGRSVHGSPAWSRPLGLLLSPARRDDPAAVPVRLAGRGWGWLTDAGEWVPVT